MATEQQAQLCCYTDGGGGGGESANKRNDAMPVAVAVSLCLLHDALSVALFLASHPLHTVYLLFFARGLLALAAFFWPLLVSTSLLLAALATVGPYVGGGGAEWPGVRSLGRTCGIAVAALCAELRPDVGFPAAGLLAQLCSFVLGPTDAASVLRVEEIMGEPCAVITTASCFVPEKEQSLLLLIGGDDCKEPAFALPVMDYIGDRSLLDYGNFHDLKDKIDEKVVISEGMKGSDPLAEQCCFPRDRDTSLVQEMEAEEEEESSIQGQDLILSAIYEVSDGVEEKRLECDPVSVEIKKSEPVQVLEIRKSQPMQAMEITKLEPLEPIESKKLEINKFEPLHAIEIKKYEPAQAVQIKKFEPAEPPEVKEYETVQAVQIKKWQPTLEIQKSEPVESVEIKKNELVKPRSLIAQRIKLWEAQVVSGNAKPFVAGREENAVEFSLKNKPAAKYAKKYVRFEADPCAEKCRSDQQAQVSASTEQCVEQQQEQEFKDVKQCMYSETEASEKCSQDMKAEEITPAVVAQAEQELLEQGCNDVLQELEYQIAQPEQELEEMEEMYNDVTQSPAMWNARESPLKSTSIAGRVHSRTSSENLLSEGSPSRKDKEWKRTLACKLYEERMQLRLCRDRAVVEGSDNMDMLWEAYEVGSGGNKGRGGKRSGSKVKGSTSKVDDAVEEGEEEEEDADDDEEGSVRQLCCLQALKFSTRKMNFGGGKPSLSKIAKVLKRMTALSRMGPRRKQSE
ncbi:hypothetical protein BDA96_05G122300 [Sorghum bicolor]|jgi:hypothetical protein|uniref:Uncharacterized protein n=2 Tax=Sorghum bicolor TaxID=4558 RepID=C5Y268_SORBI|nr:uncharacterized protein LOC8071844 [Sorghum bicolor]EES08434.1 hypothetical protein SORBI_3005G110900 [Sorghum bicolor]KAG0529722.1 hypothetical protein BDA96_05G122300 [Sorghum bicolor]|eukprot:XP_002449446.1 uncharacterized protein LOC8071844 [Sorghum bicolor]